jgi:hypothetical protein
MSALQGAAESGGVPVSRLHERQSFDPADFPVPTGREEEWRFTARSSAPGTRSPPVALVVLSGSGVVAVWGLATW